MNIDMKIYPIGREVCVLKLSALLQEDFKKIYEYLRERNQLTLIFLHL